MGRPIKYNEEERKAARVATYKKYGEKKINFAISYTPVDREEGQRLKRYLSSTNQSANSYIKSLIKSDLDSKGIK